MDVMSPSKDALNSPLSIDYWFYYIIMLFEGVRAEKQKGNVTTRCSGKSEYLVDIFTNWSK